MKKGDKIISVIVIVLIIISTAGIFIYKSYSKGSKKIAIVKQNGKIIRTIDLNSINGSEEFTVKYDKIHFNKIKIENGKIAIIDADCPDKICVKTGWISEPGESAVCLPHKLIVKINGKNSPYDDISK